MAEQVASLSAYAERFGHLVDPEALREMGNAAGMAAKTAGLGAAVMRLGPDKAMSNFRSGRVRLGVGYDYEPGTTQVVVNHRPAGVWMLADRGRTKSGRIYPRSGSARNRKGRKTIPGRAVLTPNGPRASSSYGPSRGTGVLRLAAAREREAAPKAASVTFTRRVAAVAGRTVMVAGKWGS